MTRELAASPPAEGGQSACVNISTGRFHEHLAADGTPAERLEALDKVARPLAGAVGRAVRPRVVRNLLSGTDLGHPLHPVLTDLPIGAWVMSALLDAAGGPAAEGAADLLVAAGVVAAVPTAAAGLNDWSDTAGPRDPGRAGARRAEHHRAEPVPGLPGLARPGTTARRQGAGPGRAGGADGRRVPGRALVLRYWAWMSPHRVGAAAVPVDAGAGRHRTGRRAAPQGRRGRRAGPAVPDRGNGVRPGQHVQLTWAARWRRAPSATAASSAHGTAAPSGSPTAPSCAARPARRSPLPDAHPGRAHRGPRHHITVAYLSRVTPRTGRATAVLRPAAGLT